MCDAQPSFVHRNLPRLLLEAREAVMLHTRPSLREHGLSDQQWRVLRVLGEHAGDPAGVRRAARAGYAIVLATQLCSAVVLLLGHDAIVAVYTRDVAVAALASTLLLYAAAFQFPDGIQVMSAGSLRGLRDTRVPMFLAMAAYWGLGMPLGAGLGLGLGWGPQGMWAGLIVGLSAAAVLMGWRLSWRLNRLPLPVAAPGGTLTSGA